MIAERIDIPKGIFTTCFEILPHSVELDPFLDCGFESGT